jgi:hypothetical protein
MTLPPTASSPPNSVLPSHVWRQDDIIRLEPDTEHPRGLTDGEFDALFTVDQPMIFAYHGSPLLIHRLTYQRTNHRTSTCAVTRRRARPRCHSTWSCSTTWTASTS